MGDLSEIKSADEDPLFSRPSKEEQASIPIVSSPVIISFNALKMKHTPKTLPHVFDLKLLVDHFNKNPLSSAACALIDLPGDQFLPTEDEVSVIAAALWVLCVRYDNMAMAERPSTRDDLRKWVVKHRPEVMDKLLCKVEPPFHAQTVDILFRDVATMLDEILSAMLPPPPSPAEKKGKEPAGKPEAKAEVKAEA